MHPWLGPSFPLRGSDTKDINATYTTGRKSGTVDRNQKHMLHGGHCRWVHQIYGAQVSYLPSCGAKTDLAVVIVCVAGHLPHRLWIYVVSNHRNVCHKLVTCSVREYREQNQAVCILYRARLILNRVGAETPERPTSTQKDSGVSSPSFHRFLTASKHITNIGCSWDRMVHKVHVHFLFWMRRFWSFPDWSTHVTMRCKNDGRCEEPVRSAITRDADLCQRGAHGKEMCLNPNAKNVHALFAPYGILRLLDIVHTMSKIKLSANHKERAW